MRENATRPTVEYTVEIRAMVRSKDCCISEETLASSSDSIPEQRETGTRKQKVGLNTWFSEARIKLVVYIQHDLLRRVQCVSGMALPRVPRWSLTPSRDREATYMRQQWPRPGSPSLYAIVFRSSKVIVNGHPLDIHTKRIGETICRIAARLGVSS